MKEPHSNILFFLCLSNEIPDWYPDFSRRFHDFGYDLVPLDVNQLSELSHNHRSIQIVTVITSFSNKAAFEMRFKHKLSYFFNAGMAYFHVLSSFRKFDLMLPRARKNRFHFMALPLELDRAVERIVKKVEVFREGGERWPGGKRVGLPKSVIGG